MLEKINATTYKSTFPRGSVRVGGVGEDTFRPEMELDVWEGECRFKASLPDQAKRFAQLPEQAAETAVEKVEAALDNRKALFYDLPPTDQYREGGFEFEVVLEERPADNRVVFDIETENLNFYYQPPLSEAEIEEGAEQPENVVGSYAVYHATCGNVHRSKERAEKYRTGKAFHIYRPLVKDADGNETWGELSIDEEAGTLTIAVDEGWLEAAVYPVSVDPTFGYTEVGERRSTLSRPVADEVDTHSAVPGDTVTEVHAHFLYETYSENAWYDLGLYDMSDGEPVNLIGSTGPQLGKDVEGSESMWESFDVEWPMGTGEYCLAIALDGQMYGIRIHYDDVDDVGTRHDEWIWDMEELPTVWDMANRYEDARLSLYAVYEPAVPDYQATANGEITDTGGAACTERGFVYGTTSQSDPGDTPPGDTTYTDTVSESGTFGTGTFSLQLTGLEEGETYYIRAYAQNEEGYSYGEEQSFVVEAPPEPYEETLTATAPVSVAVDELFVTAPQYYTETPTVGMPAAVTVTDVHTIPVPVLAAQQVGDEIHLEWEV